VKIPFMSTTSDRIATARQALATAETNVGNLERNRASAIADTDDLERVGELDLRLGRERQVVQACRDRIQALESKHLVETETARRQEYAAAITAIDASMESLERAAATVEEAAMALSSAARLYTDACQSILASWPANVPKPGRIHGSYPLSAHYVDSYRLGNLLRAFTPNGSRPSPADFVYRCTKAPADIDGFGAAEARNRAALIAELRSRGPPPVEPADDVVEVEAA
jgi:hypothetical protein